jgi:hypothetical protein
VNRGDKEKTDIMVIKILFQAQDKNHCPWKMQGFIHISMLKHPFIAVQ